MLVKNLSGGLSSRRVVTRSNVTTTVAKATKGTAGSKGSRGVSMPLFNPNEKDFKQKKDASANAPKLLTRYDDGRDGERRMNDEAAPRVHVRRACASSSFSLTPHDGRPNLASTKRRSC